MASLNQGILSRVQIPYAPLPEQRAIAAALSDVDGLLGGLDRLIAKKRDLKQAAMQQLLTGQTRLPGFCSSNTSHHRSTFGEFPADWKLLPLSQVSAFITKGSTPTTYGFEWVSSGVLFLRSECVSERGLDLSQSMFVSLKAHQLLRRSEVKSGDILMTITGNVGRVVHLGAEFQPSNINQHIARIRISDDQVASAFVFHFLSQPLVRKYYNQITTGQAYPQISLKQVRNTVLPMPPLAEQTAIATVLSEMDGELAVLEQRREKTRALKQAMMQELLTGRTRLI
ncbi:MAG: restriction endonuclease subunit S [Verrucomicrobiota bacterium]|nr:restriction endonuclease subunit S [Verrucomicrobiota bacterium]